MENKKEYCLSLYVALNQCEIIADSTGLCLSYMKGKFLSLKNKLPEIGDK